MGETAERFVTAHLRDSLPEGTRLQASGRFVAKTRLTGAENDRQADLVIVHSENGLLVAVQGAGAAGRNRVRARCR